MSDLIPTSRTDKNGRTVTRHMKPHNTSTGATGTPIPRVKKVSQKEHQQVVLEAVMNLCEALIQRYDDDSVRRIRDSSIEVIGGYSTSTEQRIRDTSWGHYQAMQLATSIRPDKKRQWDETKVNDFLVLLGNHEDDKINDWHLNSYHLYEELCPPNNAGDYPEERRSQINALLTVTDKMYSSAEHVLIYDDETKQSLFFIVDPELRSLVLNPGKHNRDEVVAVIVGTDTFDASRIRMMLDADVPSLGSGLL